MSPVWNRVSPSGKGQLSAGIFDARVPGAAGVGAAYRRLFRRQPDSVLLPDYTITSRHHFPESRQRLRSIFCITIYIRVD